MIIKVENKRKYMCIDHSLKHHNSKSSTIELQLLRLYDKSNEQSDRLRQLLLLSPLMQSMNLPLMKGGELL